jgi:hypothetical protein
MQANALGLRGRNMLLSIRQLFLKAFGLVLSIPNLANYFIRVEQNTAFNCYIGNRVEN